MNEIELREAAHKYGQSMVSLLKMAKRGGAVDTKCDGGHLIFDDDDLKRMYVEVQERAEIETPKEPPRIEQRFDFPEQDYPAKQKYRDCWMQFLQNNYRGGCLKDAKVGFLPGPDEHEIRMYDKLGIPRTHLYGAENNKERFNCLKAKNTGINLFYGDVCDLLEKQQFNIVHLDYQQQLREPQMKALQLIAKNKTFGGVGILGTNFYGKREQGGTKTSYDTALIQRIINANRKKLMRISSIDESENLELPPHFEQSIKEDIEQTSLEEKRDKGITLTLHHILSQVSYGKNPHYLALLKHEIKDCEEYKNSSDMPYEHYLNLNLALRTHLIRYCSEFGNRGRMLATMLSDIIEIATVPYWIEKIERYKYTGGRGSTMYSDFLVLNGRRELAESTLIQTILEKAEQSLERLASKRLGEIVPGIRTRLENLIKSVPNNEVEILERTSLE